MDEEVKNQTEILKEILKWIKFSGMKEVKQVLNDALNSDIKKLVYYHSDGKSSDEIEKLFDKKVSDMSVRNWWKMWARIGIMDSHPGYKKRYIKIFNPEDFGIEIPDISNKIKSKKQEEDNESGITGRTEESKQEN